MPSEYDQSYGADGSVRAPDGLYDDGSGPAAMPVMYEGPQPSQPDSGTTELARPIAIAQPVLIDTGAGGGITASAPKPPETATERTVVPTPVLRADDGASKPGDTAGTRVEFAPIPRVVVVSLVLLAVVVAVISYREGSSE
jgi:hypothetical protein